MFSIILVCFVGMPGGVPTVLILGHSFVRRMQDDLSARFHPRTDLNFNLSDATVCFHGVGGRTEFISLELTISTLSGVSNPT